MSDLNFTPVLAIRVASFHIYERGKKYFESGNVKKVWEEDSTTHAMVRGTHNYQVILFFDDTDELAYDCSCPHESDRACKHVVAVILACSDLPTSQPARRPTPKHTNPLKKITLPEAKSFLTKLTTDNPHLLDELEIFLQGSEETSTAITDYQDKFAYELSQLDSLKLLESYHEDTWTNTYDDGDEYDHQLAIWVEDIKSLASSYENNHNYAEAIKISVSAISAFADRGQELVTLYSDLEEWVNQCTEDLLWSLHQLINDLPSQHLPTAITHTTSLLSQKSAQSSHHRLASYLAKMYQTRADWTQLTEFAAQYLPLNPSISIPLLEYYQQEDDLDAIRTLAEQALHLLTTQKRGFHLDLNHTYIPDKLEAQLRQFLAKVYPVESEYQTAITNLQQLFLASHDLGDYRLLRKAYRTKKEKESFWARMEKELLDQYDVKAVFDVYQLEGQDAQIIALAQQHSDIKCFPAMIDYIKGNHAKKSFELYQTRIDKLLAPASPNKYHNIATNLTHMRTIGLDEEFDIYLNFIKVKYKRRRRLLQELARQDL